MSRFHIWLIQALNRCVPPPASIQELDAAKLGVEDYQAWEYAEIRKLAPEFGPRWQPAGKRLLDVGSGLGGKPRYYAEQGAALVAGLDLRFGSARATTQLGQRHGQRQIQGVYGHAARQPFAGNAFDLIVSVNVFEHVDDLRAVLSECRRVLAPGGLIFLHFPPFYSPWGAHLEGWINFPWPHVFFSDRDLLQATARIDARLRKNSAYIPTAQFDWASYEQLPELNRTTVSSFYRLLDEVRLQVLEAHLLPFGRHFLPRQGAWGRAALAVLRQLTRLPLLREVLTTKMVFVLTRAEESAPARSHPA